MPGKNRNKTTMNIDLLLASYDYLEPRKEAFAREFYARLFVLSPDAQALFMQRFSSRNVHYRVQMKRQEASLMATLKAVIDGIKSGNPTTLPGVQALGRRHVGYGVDTQSLYEAVGKCLIETLQDFMGVAFTPDMRASWVEAYGLLQSAMIPARERG